MLFIMVLSAPTALLVLDIVIYVQKVNINILKILNA